MLLVIIVVLLIVDRVGNYIAERVAANTIKSSQGLSSTPDVDISGFPFITQLIARDFDKITVTAKDVPIQKDRDLLNLSRLQIVLHHVTAPVDLSSVHADTATAAATVSYAELSKRLGVDVSYAGNGRVKASKSLTIAGTPVTLQLTAAPAVVDGVLSFGQVAINGLGSLQLRIPDNVRQIFEQQFSLQGFPFGLRVQSMSVDSDGIQLVLAGSNLTYHRQSS